MEEFGANLGFYRRLKKNKPQIHKLIKVICEFAVNNSLRLSARLAEFCVSVL